MQSVQSGKLEALPQKKVNEMLNVFVYSETEKYSDELQVN